MGKRKYLGSVNKDYIKKYKSKIIRVEENDTNGYASLVLIEEVHRPFMAGEICLYNAGYSEIGFLPDNENWMLWALYNDKGEIIEWYFDVTKINATDEKGNPYCDDLYLDAALTPDGKITILDEDELKEALDNGEINQSEFEMAYHVIKKLTINGMFDTTFMHLFCSKLRMLFTLK